MWRGTNACVHDFIFKSWVEDENLRALNNASYHDTSQTLMLSKLNKMSWDATETQIDAPPPKKCIFPCKLTECNY